MARVYSGMHTWMGYLWGRGSMIRQDERSRGCPYDPNPPNILTGFERCRTTTAQKFGLTLMDQLGGVFQFMRRPSYMYTERWEGKEARQLCVARTDS
jgi:hypothetical protein